MLFALLCSSGGKNDLVFALWTGCGADGLRPLSVYAKKKNTTTRINMRPGRRARRAASTFSVAMLRCGAGCWLRGDLQARAMRRQMRSYEREAVRWDIGRPVDNAVGYCDDAYVLMQSVGSPKFTP